jgi:hypothetical protein
MAALSSLQDLKRSLIRKTPNLSVFYAEYSAPKIDAATLFATATCALTGPLPAGYHDLGLTTDAGAVFDRSLSVSNVQSAQSVAPTRSDPTSDVITLKVSPQETKKATIALGTGASAELRQPLGVAVVGGLLASQALTLFVTPVIYVYFENLSGWLLGLFSKKGRPELHAVEPVEQPSLFGAEPQKTAAE